MNTSKLELPEFRPAIKENGDIVLEATHQGEVVGGLNMTRIVSNWFKILGICQPEPGTQSLVVHGDPR